MTAAAIALDGTQALEGGPQILLTRGRQPADLMTSERLPEESFANALISAPER